MNRRIVLLVGIFIFIGLLFIPASVSKGSKKMQDIKRTDSQAKPQVLQPTFNNGGKVQVDMNFGKFPLYFIVNKGQVNKKAKFYAKASRYTLWLTKQGLVFDGVQKVKEGKQTTDDRRQTTDDSNNKGVPGKVLTPDIHESIQSCSHAAMQYSPHSPYSPKTHRDVSRLIFLNANKNAEMVPVEETKLRVNYFKGNDRSKWHCDVPTSQAVLYKNLYKNIDLKVYGIEKQIEYDWIVKPGGDPGEIRIQYQNVKSTRLDDEGNLLIETKFGELIHKKPVSFQKRPAPSAQRKARGADVGAGLRACPGERSDVDAAFKKIDENIYGFAVGDYDRNYELIIDPVVLAYSTYLGGQNTDEAKDIVLDGSGYLYVVGCTLSWDFPVLNQYQSDQSNYDVFISKFDTSGSGVSSLLYSTYLGGNYEDYGLGIALDSSGIVYVTGYTRSNDFPTLNPYMNKPPYSSWDYSRDAFITKLDITQSGAEALLYSTYLGGQDNDYGWRISADDTGKVIIAGMTESDNFPTLNQFQTYQYLRDGFVAKLDTTQSGSACLLYSTYLGGNSTDYLNAMAVDSSGYVYVVGYTESLDFPTRNQFQDNQRVADAFLTKMDLSQSGDDSLLYSTYLGGYETDTGAAVAVDNNGIATIGGSTYSSDFPLLNSYQTYNSNGDAFIMKLDTLESGANCLVYSTYLGGSSSETINALTLDGSGNVYAVGITNSTDFPILHYYQTDQPLGDLMVLKLDPYQSGTDALLYSTYLGGDGAEYPRAIILDSSEDVYIAGYTESTNFPTLNQYQDYNTDGDAFITRLYFQTLPTVTTDNVSSITVDSASGGGNVTGDGRAEVTARGICWSTFENPAIEDSHTTDGSGTGSFTGSLTNLTPSTLYYVRAYASNSVGTAYGNEVSFETLDPSITVTYPNGGELFVVGSGVNITWTSEGVQGNVKIEYSVNNGESWAEITASTENDGTHQWTVPAAPSYQCLTRVSESDGSPADTSDSVFTIATSAIVIPLSEREALIALYNSTSGDHWLGRANWKKPDGSFNDPGTEHTWYGITVENNHVVEIDLSYNELEGTLPVEIGNFPQLTKLDLKMGYHPAFDFIYGPIPTTIGNLAQLVYLDFSGNDLDGNIPVEIGNLSNLEYLNLHGNALSGSIPTSLGNLLNLQKLIISSNWLSGNFPGSLTNLVNLRELHLNANDIAGNIPSDIGNLTGLEYLGLGGNALTGAIPTSLGNLVNLNKLYLRSNNLVGSIPTGLTGLTALVETDIGYNGLYTDDEALIAFLNQVDPDWQSTQTVVPADVSAAVVSGSSILVSWTPIMYTADEGGYRVFYSTTAGGPYTFFDITEDKTVSSMMVTGLVPDTPYYFVVQTRTLGSIYSYNENTVDSEYSNEVSAATYSTITVTSPNGGEQWQVGTQQTITWTSEGTVGNVRIEYSTNGGNSWGIITPSTENNGRYNWNVPYRPSVNCLVRVSEQDMDGGPADVSDAVFSIVSPVTGTLTLRSPNGGETWLAGSTQQIKWNSTGDINYVTIKYSTDNGTTWKTIAKNALNNHSYNWVVPGEVSDRCLVRITANDSDLDPKPSDVSDAVFSIILPPAPTIKVIAPNGGEQLEVGSRFTVTWGAANTRADVRIEYSVNGGESWREIAAAAGNNGKYDWTVPDAPSDNCLVRVSEIDGQPSDVSDALFSIVSPTPGDITLTVPNGGETWTAGDTKQINWTSSGGIDSVKIEYTRDNGTTWEMIVQTTPNSGGFDWTIPGALSSDECRVRITSNDVNSDPIPADISDAVFSIGPPASPTITVIAPNGGEQLLAGSRFNITWNAVNSREDVKIEYSVNGGEQWIIITDAADNNGDYAWLVPDTPAETCLVRISETDGEPVDVSDAVFSIARPVPGEVTVISPNGGESWAAGTIKEITWTAGGINNVKVEYSTDYGTTWQVIIQTMPNNGSFNWAIPDTVSDECLVRVSSNDGDPDPVSSDVSDQIFSITPGPVGEFRVTSPNGEEKWEVGSTQPIKWTNSGDINNVMIEYSYDNGNTWNTIVSSLGNSGNYDWTIPNTVSDECLVRISANDGEGDPQPTDVSDAVFSILHPAAPTIRVITPNGGEQLVIGTIYEITWFGTDSRAEVKIEYSTDGGAAWTGITAATENDGNYDWTVPAEHSDICLVRISEIDGEPVDVSDAVFSFVQPQTGDLTVLTPNGGENLESGSEYNITWTCSGLNNVILEHSTNNGETWLYIDKVPADNGSYPWTVPGTPSEMCLVRVSGADADENPADVSDGVFTIFDPSQASIEVFTPNGGESLSVGEEYYITWASSGINNVLIQYSTTNGEQWTPIDTVPALGGRYTWTVPGTPSETCLIRISEKDTGEPSDVSDAVFSIVSN